MRSVTRIHVSIRRATAASQRVSATKLLSTHRVLHVLVLSMAALVFAGNAWGAGRSGPLSVSVKKGTLTHGNAASLNAIDGDTLDVVAHKGTNSYIMALFADFGQEPTVGRTVIVHVGGWAEPIAVRCQFQDVYSGFPPSRWSIRTQLTTFDEYYDFPTPRQLLEKVRCTSQSAFTLHLDELTAESR